MCSGYSSLFEQQARGLRRAHAAVEAEGVQEPAWVIGITCPRLRLRSTWQVLVALETHTHTHKQPAKLNMPPMCVPQRAAKRHPGPYMAASDAVRCKVGVKEGERR